MSTLASLSLAPEAWGTISPAGFAPLARTEFTLVHDPERARFVMYGGIEGTGLDVPGYSWTAPAVWFLTDDGVPLGVPGTRPPAAGLALTSCRLVGADRVSVRYTVSDPGALAIDVLEIQGRRLGRSEVPAAPAGSGETTVVLSRAASPGVAIVCVRQGARMATRKLAMIR